MQDQYTIGGQIGEARALRVVSGEVTSKERHAGRKDEVTFI